MKPTAYLVRPLVVAFALSCPVGAMAAEDGLNLICFGQGEVMGSRSTNELVWDSDSKSYRRRDGIRTEMQGFDTAVTIQIHGWEGRIRLPKKLVPPLHGANEGDGWWTLTDVRMAPDEISGGYKLNGLNHPKFRIDRTTGMIVIKGFGQDFTGRCDAVDEGQKRF
ncbi:MAG: hypothetical protein ABW184_08180 [Sphingobium sp.]